MKVESDCLKNDPNMLITDQEQPSTKEVKMKVFVDHVTAPKDVKEAVLVWEYKGRNFEVPLDRFDKNMHQVLFCN